MIKMSRFLKVALVSSIFPLQAFSYSASTHIKLSQLAFEMLQTCQQPSVFNSEQTAEWAGREDTDPYKNFLSTRSRNWHFYGGTNAKDVNFLHIPGVRMTFHSRWDELTGYVKEIVSSHESKGVKTEEMQKAVGSLVHFIQDVTNPAHVIPVYHGPAIPFYQEHIDDGFDEYPIQVNEVRQLFASRCASLNKLSKESLRDIMHSNAQFTLSSVETPFMYSQSGHNYQTTFEKAYWSKQGQKQGSFFGKYGAFQNSFGENSLTLPDGQKISIDQKVFVSFATQQQLAAITATAAAFIKTQALLNNN